MTSKFDDIVSPSSAWNKYISQVLDTMSGSRHFVTVTRNPCWSSVYGILLKFENLPVIVSGRKRILSVTREIAPDSDRWPVVISCTVVMFFLKVLNYPDEFGLLSYTNSVWKIIIENNGHNYIFISWRILSSLNNHYIKPWLSLWICNIVFWL